MHCALSKFIKRIIIKLSLVSGPSEITHIVVDPFILSERDERYTKFKEIVFTTFEKKKLYILSPILDFQRNLINRRKLLNVLGEIMVQFNPELRTHRKNL